MLISTVIRTYNREHLLARAVDSVLAQELGPEQHEVLVINDAGVPIHKADWQNDNRVKNLQYKQNQFSICRQYRCRFGKWRLYSFFGR